MPIIAPIVAAKVLALLAKMGVKEVAALLGVSIKAVEQIKREHAEKQARTKKE